MVNSELHIEAGAASADRRWVVVTLVLALVAGILGGAAVHRTPPGYVAERPIVTRAAPQPEVAPQPPAEEGIPADAYLWWSIANGSAPRFAAPH